MSTGIIGYYTDDFNNNGSKELIVTICKEDQHNYYRNNIYVQLYSYSQNEGVVLKDEKGKIYPLKFDCKKCEMSILSPN